MTPTISSSREILARALMIGAMTVLTSVAACGDAAAPAGPGGQPGGQPGPVDPNVVAKIEFSADSIDVLANGWAMVRPVVRNARGDELHDKYVQWSSTDSSIAVVTGSGAIAAGRVGTATLTASVGAKSAALRVRVVPVGVARIEPSKPSVALEAGFSEWVGVVLVAADGRVLTDRVVRWSSSDSSIVSVADGKVRGLRQGVANVIAESEGQRATIRVEVAYPKVSRRYRLSVTNLKGDGTTCYLYGIDMLLETSNGQVRGIVEPSSTGMKAGCSITPGGKPPFSTPEAPFEIGGQIDGLVLRLAGTPHWQFIGNFRGNRTITGTVTYSEYVDGELRVRTGQFELFDPKDQ